MHAAQMMQHSYTTQASESRSVKYIITFKKRENNNIKDSREEVGLLCEKLRRKEGREGKGDVPVT